MQAEQWFGGNEVQLLEGGEEYFSLLTEHIHNARSEILFEAYIYHEDRVGMAIAEALMSAAKRGVKVVVTLDGIGCFSLSSEFVSRLKEAGVDILIFRPLHFFPRLRNLLSERLHRKIVVIDKHIVFVGGMNITEEQLFSHPSKARMDHAVKIKGPVVEFVRRVLLGFRFRIERKWVEWSKAVRDWRREEIQNPDLPAKAAFVIRDNFRYRKKMERHFRKGFDQAQSQITIAAAYFLPGRRLFRSLILAARRGVRVRLILEGKVEFPWLKWATSNLYQRMLKAGIEIYEYQPYILHSKLICVDRHWTSIGSCNLDPISLFLNLEANLVIDDESFGQEVESKLEELCRDSKAVTLESLAKRPWWKNLLARASYTFLRIASQIFLGAV